MEKPIGQLLARNVGVDQLEILDGGNQGTALNPRVVLGHNMGSDALGDIAWIEIGNPSAIRRLGEKLHKDTAGTPIMAWAFWARSQLLGDREPHARRNLFGAAEIFMRRLFKATALK